MEGDITEDMLKAALAKQFEVDAGQDVKVRSTDVSERSSALGGFTCDMRAVSVVADVRGREDGSVYFYMAKCMPASTPKVALLKAAGAFLNEVTMYTDILPKLKQLDPRLQTPMTFYADTDKGVMLMENLKMLDYNLIDKTKGLTMSEVKMVLTQLAVLHATSFHLIQSHNGGEEGFRKTYPSLNVNSLIRVKNEKIIAKLEGMFYSYTNIAASIVEESAARDNQELAERAKAFLAIQKEKVDACNRKRGKFDCIIHNDSHFNNYMFKQVLEARTFEVYNLSVKNFCCRRDKNSGVSTDIKTFDLQGCRIARPSIDLAYFLSTSTRPSFRREHLKSLLTFYHEVLINVLNKLGYNGEDVYSFGDMMEDFKDCMAHGYVAGQRVAMVILTPQEGFTKFDLGAAVDEGKDTEAAASRLKEAWLKEARNNQALRDTLVEIAEEAAEWDVI